MSIEIEEPSALPGIAAALTTAYNSITNPASGNHNSQVMAGFAAAAQTTPSTFKPVTTGNVLLCFMFHATDNTAGNTITFTLRTGTGTAPVDGAAATGTQRGATHSETISSGGGGGYCCVIYLVKGLTTGTTYWADIAYGSGSGTDTSQLINADFWAMETG